MKEVIIAVISAIGSAGFFTFLQFLISRTDARNSDIKDIKKKLTKIEKDSIRTQMLMLMQQYPDNEHEVLTLAEYYFTDLHANFYMTSMFTKWLALNHIEIPGWFIQAERNSHE